MSIRRLPPSHPSSPFPPPPLLRQSGGAARTGQLLAAGFSWRDINQLEDSGAHQPKRGVFFLPGCDPGIASAILHNGRLTCASAAGHYGLWLRDPPSRHHPACNHGHGGGFIRHRSVRFAGHPLLPLAAVEDVALHALGCLPTPASTALATSAVRLHGVPVKLLKDQLRGDRSRPVLRALRELDLRAESIVEVDAQHLFRTNGISYEPQVFLQGIGRVDFLLDGFPIVEIDGSAVLRYMTEHIWFQPHLVLADIRAVLRSRAEG